MVVFSITSSILEQLCGSLCNAVTGREDSQTVLEALEQANLFITPPPQKILTGQPLW